MNLEEIQQSLPNGLHDAQIIRISLDYVKREVRLDLEISWSDPDDDLEIWRSATLVFASFLYCIIEAPDPEYPFATRKGLLVDAGSEDRASQSGTQLPEQLPKGAFKCWFYVNDWNSFIHLAALNAEITLHGEVQ